MGDPGFEITGRAKSRKSRKFHTRQKASPYRAAFIRRKTLLSNYAAKFPSLSFSRDKTVTRSRASESMVGSMHQNCTLLNRAVFYLHYGDIHRFASISSVSESEVVLLFRVRIEQMCGRIGMGNSCVCVSVRRICNCSLQPRAHSVTVPPLSLSVLPSPFFAPQFGRPFQSPPR